MRCELTNLFFPALKFDPVHCDSIVLLIKGANKFDLNKELFVNGKSTPFSILKQTGPDLWLLAGKEPFEPWENVVAFEAGVNRLSELRIYPSFKKDPRKLQGPDRHPLTGRPTESKTLALQFIKNSLNSSKHSSFSGIFYPAYDLDHHTYRLPSWTWCSAEAIKDLLEEYRISSEKPFLSLAESSTQNLLKFQVKDGEEQGGFMVRWDYWEDSPIGIVPWLAPNDSAFIGSYALLPMYVETGNKVYLESAIQIGEWIIRRGIDQNGRIYGGFRLDTKTWEKDWLYVDAGFTMTIFYGLWKVTHDERWRHYLRLITEDFINRFFSPKGYFYARWESPNFLRKIIFTRGQAWALDGIIAAYLGLKDPRYIETALHCSRFLTDRQKQDGSWNYHRNPPVGPCSKAIPILAYHFLRLYRICGDKSLYQAARRSLDWCEKNQYRGSDPRALGGIHGQNEEGCIVGVRGVDNIFTYANAYYVMALNLWNEI